jgi:pimeloyl-ACP methyl ester carboxylesterase
MPIATSPMGHKVPYKAIGSGPALILIHGAFECAYSHSDLAKALSPHFTAITYNRRGRLDNAEYGDSFSMATEVDDLHTLLTATGARFIFGISSGALICLGAMRDPKLEGMIDKAAIYEPVISIDGSVDFTVLSKYDQAIKDERYDRALVYAMLGTEMGPRWLHYMPTSFLVGMTRWMMDKQEKGEAKKAEQEKKNKTDVKAASEEASGKVEKKEQENTSDVSADQNMPTLRAYAPTLRGDLVLVKEMADSIASFKVIQTKVLLMNGDNSPKYLLNCLGPLDEALPKCKRVEFKGCDHGMCFS